QLAFGLLGKHTWLRETWRLANLDQSFSRQRPDQYGERRSGQSLKTLALTCLVQHGPKTTSSSEYPTLLERSVSAVTPLVRLQLSEGIVMLLESRSVCTHPPSGMIFYLSCSASSTGKCK